MTRRTIFLFSGQGTQYHQMGAWLYENDEVFRSTLRRLDDVVREERGEGVLKHIYGPGQRIDEPFGAFRDTQPAIFMLEYALARALDARGVRPDAVVGASLGELAAAAVAGAADATECVALLVQQAEVFDRSCPPGGMLAVLAEPGYFDREPALHEHCELAGVNSPGNFVVAGAAADLARAEQALAERAVLCQRLPVPYAFHSSHIEAVRDEFAAMIGKLSLHGLAVPLRSATTGGELHRLTGDHIWQVMRRPFDLRPVLDSLLDGGDTIHLDLGPSGSLANLLAPRIPPGSASRALPLLSPFSRDGALFRRVLDEFGDLPAASAPAVAAARPRTELAEDPPRSAALRVHVFPGQGSQTKGMGGDLFDRFPELTATADEILGYSIRSLCLDDPDRRLRQTEYTQPALYIVGALTHLAELQKGERLPDYVMGHSLGEFVALFAAGAFDFETGLRLVQSRGKLMARSSEGTMLAVTGSDVGTIRDVLAAHALDEIDVANLNAPTQTVLAGPKSAIDRAAPLLTATGARCVQLSVSAPFHSRYMAEAAREFAQVLEGFTFAAPKIPVIANVDALPYRDAADVRTKLARQIDGAVQWVQCVRYVMSRGALDMRELGPGTVLTKLAARIQEETPPDAADVLIESGSAEASSAPVRSSSASTARTLGSAAFREAYGVDYAYVVGGMHHAIASVDLVARLADARVLSFLGTAGLDATRIEESVLALRNRVGPAAPFGLNLTFSTSSARAEADVIDISLRTGVHALEISAYVQITDALVRYRLQGARVDDDRACAPNRLLAKATRPDVARMFFEPPPPTIVERLLARGEITAAEAAAAPLLPMADDVCAVGDSGGYTDMAALLVLLPALRRLRDASALTLSGSAVPVRIGAGGGIGAPPAAAAAFLLGADFVLTGSVNACTVESGLSSRAKELLQNLDVHDTTYAPSADLFELGGRVRVMKKGVLSHARANKLYDVWRTHDSWESVSPALRTQIEERYLLATFDEAYALARAAAPADAPGTEPDPDPRQRMALVFRWYCDNALRLAVDGTPGREVDYQVWCGPALGAANQWLREAGLGAWQDRHADEICRRLMDEASTIMEGGHR